MAVMVTDLKIVMDSKGLICIKGNRHQKIISISCAHSLENHVFSQKYLQINLSAHIQIYHKVLNSIADLLQQ